MTQGPGADGQVTGMVSMSGSRGALSRFRAYIWPIYAFEFRKFLPLLIMAFCISFNYNILRNMKDALLITAKSSGAEVIPFIKVWGIVPCAFIMTFIYSRLNNKFSRDRVFYTMISIFLVFFVLFAFVLYPLRGYLHPHASADYLQAHLPAGFKGLIAIFRHWTFSLFYIMSELWSSTVLSMLFWGFANEITRLGEAQRFYSLIAAGLNCAGITAGQVSLLLTSKGFRSHLSLTQDAWYQSIIVLTVVVVASGLVILGIYHYLSKGVLVTERLREEKNQPKVKMSMRENFALLGRSRYLFYIAVIVLAYNIVINLVEVIWKDSVRALYPQPNDFNAYMSHITSITGVISTLTSLLISGQLIRRFSWTASALITPIILLATSIPFFFFFFERHTTIGVLSLLGTSPAALVVLFGSMQNCFSRAAKFTLFDGTKEMAFIPLSLSEKIKGKAAIDGVCSRLGKSGGSLIHQVLLIIFTTIAASAHIIAGILCLMILVWIGAIVSLGKQFTLLTSEKKAPLAPPVPLEESAAIK